MVRVLTDRWNEGMDQQEIVNNPVLEKPRRYEEISPEELQHCWRRMPEPGAIVTHRRTGAMDGRLNPVPRHDQTLATSTWRGNARCPKDARSIPSAASTETNPPRTVEEIDFGSFFDEYSIRVTRVPPPNSSRNLFEMFPLAAPLTLVDHLRSQMTSALSRTRSANRENDHRQSG